MALLTLISVNRLSISQLEVMMETLHLMILNGLPFMMHLDTFVMTTKGGKKKIHNYLHSQQDVEQHIVYKAWSTH